MNDDILLTREQIGIALEYVNPREAIKNIHRKHRDRLEPLSLRIKLSGCQTEPTSKSEEQECVYYTQRGVMEICRFSRQPKANQFMDWVWDIVEKYRNHEFVHISQQDNIVNEKLIELLTSMDNRLSKLEEAQTNQQTQVIETTYKKPYNPWFTKMQPKYKLLEDYFDITRGQLYKNILWELENLYDIDTQQIQADYCYKNNLLSCYPLEPYEFISKYRDMIEQIVNSNLIKYDIADEDDPITSTKHITIFDTPIEKREN